MNSYILIKSKFKINDIILKLKQINVDIYLIYTEKGYTFVKINYLDFPKVQKYYKYLNFKIVRFYGKKYYSFILKKYYLVFISFILIIAFVSFLSFFIVDIKVENENPTIGLGSVSLSPLQLCSIYNAFASEGAYYPPVFYSKITLSNNDLLINNKETPSFYLNKQIVNVLSYLLLSPFDEGLVSYTSPSLLNYQTNDRFGAKTGSTSYCSWVVGYNPNYTICVWTGNDKNNENKNSNLSKVIFQKIANNLTYNSGDIYFKIPTKSKPFSLSNKETGRTSNVYYTI